MATDFLGEKTVSPVGLTLVSAAGEDIPVLGCTTVPLGIGLLQVSHLLIIVQSFSNIGSGLPAEAQIGVRLCIKSGQNQFIHRSFTSMKDVKPMLDIARQVKNKICAVEALTETTEESTLMIVQCHYLVRNH